jgi:hypothetical protein
MKNWLHIFITSIILASVFSCHAGAGDANTDTQPVKITDLTNIFISPQAPKDLNTAARGLAYRLLNNYKIKAKLVSRLPKPEENGIILGKEYASAAGLISLEELEKVKFDGYVIKGSGSRVAIAGYRHTGAIFGCSRFLRQIGILIYPWHHSPKNYLIIFKPEPEEKVKPFSISSKPFFDYRHLMPHFDRGMFGTILDVGNPREAENRELFNNSGDWMDWFHTASYLVPKGLYYDDHPEYYGLKGGKRIPKNTRHQVTVLCLTNPDVHKISSERAVRWISMQKDKRFFGIHDGDSKMCSCKTCRASDLDPVYGAERLLKWVNAIAGEVKKKYPEKILLTAAYLETVKPSDYTKIESNVRLLYAPWFWNSRTTSAQSLNHPYNIISKEELTGWLLSHPGKVGLYEYPGSSILTLGGQVKRLRYYAKNNIDSIYFNMYPKMFSELFQYVCARLTWDPFLDSETLIDEFCSVFYGPAAEHFRKYLSLHKEALRYNARRIFHHRKLIEEGPDIFQEALKTVAEKDVEIKMRVHGHILDFLYLYLMRLNHYNNPKIKVSTATYNDTLKHYKKLHKEFIENCTATKAKYLARSYNSYQNDINKLLAKQKKAEKKSNASEKEKLTDRAAATDEKLIEISLDKIENEILRTVKFGTAEDTAEWKLYNSMNKDAAIPNSSSLKNKAAVELTGVKVTIPFSKLPVITLDTSPKGINKMHAGRFFLDSTLKTPLNTKDCRYLDIHLYTNRALPVTVFFYGQHFDVYLNAGEQIIRADFTNFKRLAQKTREGKINRLAFEFLPQNSIYPYSKTRDTEVTIISVSARNYPLLPKHLPYKNKTIWMSHQRPNIPFNIYPEIIKKHMGLPGQRDQRPHRTATFYRHERFRSFTEQRIVSPVFNILYDKENETAASELQKYLHKLFKVSLNIEKRDQLSKDESGNSIILGKRLSKSSKLLKRKEFKYVGSKGFVIHSRRGRIMIAGGSLQSTLTGVSWFLESYGVKFQVSEKNEIIPDRSTALLHESYILDFPYFKDYKLPVSWKLSGNSAKTVIPSKVIPANLSKTYALAERIKNLARNKQAFDNEILQETNRSQLDLYVAARLLWDPFLDPSELISSFQKSIK